jgi:pimeloyl-ACP methyl ester carboxylesterase
MSVHALTETPTMPSASSLIRTSALPASGVSLCGDVGGDASAQPVILLHGGGQTRHSWRRAQQRADRSGLLRDQPRRARARRQRLGQPTRIIRSRRSLRICAR